MNEYIIFLIIKNFYLNLLNIATFTKIEEKKFSKKQIFFVIVTCLSISIIYMLINMATWKVIAISVSFFNASNTTKRN